MGASTQQNTSSQTQSTQPFAGAQKGINTVLNDAFNSYRAGDFAGYTGPTTPSFSNQTMQGFRGMERNADLATPGFRQSFQAGVDQIRNPLSQAQQTSLDQYGSLARGDHMGKANPYLDQLIKQGQDSAQGAVNRQAAGMGRYGSGVHQGSIARQLGEIETGARFNDYNTQLGRQDAAMAAQANLGQQSVQNRMAAQQMLPGLYQGMNAPAETRRMVGLEFENQRQNLINDQIRRANMPYDQLMKLSGLMGIAAPYSSTQSSGVTTQPGPSPFLQGLGGIGMLGSFFGG